MSAAAFGSLSRVITARSRSDSIITLMWPGVRAVRADEVRIEPRRLGRLRGHGLRDDHGGHRQIHLDDAGDLHPAHLPAQRRAHASSFFDPTEFRGCKQNQAGSGSAS